MIISGGYDLVFLACVLHHIKPEEREKWMQAVVRHLKPGGCIAVFEHNTRNPYTKKIILNPESGDNFHYMLSHKELKDLLLNSAHDLKVVWHGYTLFSLFRPFWMIRAEMLLKWCGIGAQQCVVVQKQYEKTAKA